MAEGSINLPRTPESTRKDGSNNMRRNSTGKASASNKAEKVLPHYLRASTGSCHDFCKYGRKHAFDTKERRPVLLKNVTKPPDGRNSVECVEPPHRKRTSTVKLQTFPKHEMSAREKSGYLKQKVVTKSSADSFGVVKQEEATIKSHVDTSGITDEEAVMKPPVGTSGVIQREVVTDSHADTSRVADRDVPTIIPDVIFVEKEVITSSSGDDTSSIIKHELLTNSPPIDAANSHEIIKLEAPASSSFVDIFDIVPERCPDRRMSSMESKVLVEKKKTMSAVNREALTRPSVGSAETSKQKTSRKPLGGQIPKKKTSEVLRSSFLDTSEIVKRSDERSTAKNKVIPAVKLKSLPISTSHFSGNPKLSKLKVSSPSKLKAVPRTQVASLRMKSVTDNKASPSSILSGGLHSRRNNGVKSGKNTSPSSELSGGLHGRSSNTGKSGNNTTSSYSSIKPGRNTKTTNAAAKEVLRTPHAKPSLRSKVVTSRNDTQKTELEQRKPKKANEEDAVEEKTLYVIKMKTEKIHLQSDQNKRCTLESIQPQSPRSSSSRNEEREDEYEFSTTEPEDEYPSDHDDGSKGEHKNNTRRNHPVRSPADDETSKQVKLHFKRGTIVDIQSETNSTRRLKFRRGTVLGENQNNIKKASSRRIFKKRDVDGNNDNNNTDHEKVVLRHQDVVQQGKKDTQGLFNNVIEETASKLVETRKSKVKALVGAFETVISLQEI